MMLSQRIGKRCVQAACWCCLATWASTAAAQGLFGPNADRLALPANGGNVQGFRTVVAAMPELSVSYLPVKISIQVQGTLAADRKLIYRFETVPGGQFPPGNGMTIEVPVTLPQGTTSMDFDCYLPKWFIGRVWDVAVLEEGRALPDYTGSLGVMIRGRPSFRSSVESDLRLDVLGVGVDLPPLPSIVSQGPVTKIRLNELPTDWRGLQPFDAIVMSASTLEQLRSMESSFAAVRHWVLCGGTLVIFDAESVEAGFALADFSLLPDEASIELVTPEAIASIASSPLMFQAISSNKVIDEMADLMAQRTRVCGVGAGQLIVAEQSSTLPLAIFIELAVRKVGYRASPIVRRGVDPLLGNRRFFEWVIPGVAQPPVYTFIGLLTAFVILVGPVAYRRTTKVGRGYLMFAIAPALALLTTVAMFGYGIVSDGFGTVVRVRQLTWVDGASGDAAERVRSTYFAGIRPTEGLRFSPDAEVFGFAEGTGTAWEETGNQADARLGNVVLLPEEQRLGSSFLPSRQQRQFVSHAPRPGVGSVSLKPDPEGPTAPTVTSEFAFDLYEIVVRDDAGRFWYAEQLSAGQSKVCRLMDTNAASEKLGQMYNAHRPLSTVREQSTRTRRNSRRTYDVISSINQVLDPTTTVSDGVFELWLSRLRTSGDIPPQHFMATAEVSPDVLAVDGCETSQSIRYVFGTLR